MREELPLLRPALYNPALWSREEVKVYFTARRALLERILDDLRRERAGSPPQHRLILGLRGMGKSTLLRRLAIAVEEDAELSGQWLPLTFPEEQYNVAGLADLWLNCLDALSDWLEGRGEASAAAKLDLTIERLDKKDGEAALQALLASAKRLNRRLLLLLDNIDLILDRIKQQHWALRETLQAHPEILVIGASANVLEASYRYDAAFYDFFKVDELRGLSEEEMRDSLLNLARLRGAEEVVRRIETEPVRLRVLHTLTGGNPRTVVLLYGVLLKGVEGDVRTDLEGLLDEVTPLYKARFEELSTQAQQLLDKLALHWDPMTARQLADALGWEINPTSAQLNRLVEAGVAEKVRSGGGKRAAFQVGERFFNIWYLMRASRRVRRKLVWLVEFLRIFYSAEELKQAARGRINREACGTREAEYELALSRVLEREPLGRALETHALQSLLADGRAKLEEILDLHGEDEHLLPKAERIKALQEIRRKMGATLDHLDVHFDKAIFLERLLGSPELSLTLKQESAAALLSKDLTWKADLILTKEWQRQSRAWGEKGAKALYQAIASGEMSGMDDIPGSEAAAERFDCPMLIQIVRIEAFDRGVLTATEAEEACRKATELDPLASYAWNKLGVLLANLGRKEEAEAAHKKAIELEPKNTLYWGYLAMSLLLFTEKQVEAAEAARKAVELEPNDQYALHILATILFSIGQAQEALLHCRHLLEITDEGSFSKMWDAFLFMFKKGLEAGMGQELLKLLDETEAGQRWRPLREALAAAAAGNADLLFDVAPEVRKPAQEILARLAPNLGQAE